MSEPRKEALPIGVYRHYKGGYYQLITIARDHETGELMVVYIALSRPELAGPRANVRPLHMWKKPIVWPDGKTRPRFDYHGIEISSP